jgi:hypothetical protein
MFEGMNGDIAVAIATLPGRPSGEASIVLRMAAGAVEAAELHRGLFRGPAERFPLLFDAALVPRLAAMQSVVVVEVTAENLRRDWVYTASVIRTEDAP